MERSAHTAIETILRDELARGDTALSGVAPVLAHMLSGSGGSLVSEAIVAKLRGMLSHMASQLLGSKTPDFNADEADRLAAALANDSAILSHCYAAAIEGHLAGRLERKTALDQILTPLMQELIASENSDVAELAMAAMAAQSRFVQYQKRMHLPLTELPAELFQSLLHNWAQAPENTANEAEIAATRAGTDQLKVAYDEGATRVGLLSRLVSAMRGGARASLELEHAGFALFTTALGTLTRQARELAVLSCHERQSARLALGLRAAGMIEREIERQFALLHPDQQLPGGFDDLLPDRAQSLLGHGAMRADTSAVMSGTT